LRERRKVHTFAALYRAEVEDDPSQAEQCSLALRLALQRQCCEHVAIY